MDMIKGYNLPTAAQVAMIMPDNDSYKPPRPVKMSLRSSTANTSHHTVDHTHPSYVPLHYVLLFPHGTRGWSYDLRLANTRGLRQRTGLTQSHYYRFYIFLRPGQFKFCTLRGVFFSNSSSKHMPTLKTPDSSTWRTTKTP